MTPAKKLYDLIEVMAAQTNLDDQLTGSAIAKMSKSVHGTSEGGVHLISAISGLIEQIDSSLKSIPTIKDYQLKSYSDSLSRIRSIVAPSRMVSRWGQTKSEIDIKTLLNSLLMIDHALENAHILSFSSDEVKAIAEELDDLQAFVGNASIPKHVSRVLGLELEKLKLLIRSDQIWDEHQFRILYEALTAKLLSVSELFGEDRPGIKSRVLRMFGRVRGSMGMAADSAQIVEFARGFLSQSNGGGS